MEKAKKEVVKVEVPKEVKESKKGVVKESRKATGKFECYCKGKDKCFLISPDNRVLSPEMTEIKVKDMAKKYNK